MMNLLALIGAMLADTAFAQPVSGNANNVASGLVAVFGSGGFLGIVQALIGQIRLIIVIIGVLLIVLSGLRLISSQDDGKMEESKRVIASTCVGVMLAFMAERILSAFYSPGGTWNGGSIGTGANILATEIGGIIDWALVVIVVLSILMIVASGLKAIGSFGKQENAEEVKQTVTGVIMGIGLIMLSGVIKLALGVNAGVAASQLSSPNASVVITRAANIVMAVLQYLGLAAIAVIIYAGVLMVLNFGDEDQFQKGKGIIYRAIIGLVVVLISGIAVRFIVELFI